MRSAAVLNMGNIFSNFLISMSRYKSHLLSSEERVLTPVTHTCGSVPSAGVIHPAHAV